MQSDCARGERAQLGLPESQALEMEIERLLRDYQMALLNAEQADSHEDRAIKAVLPNIMAGV